MTTDLDELERLHREATDAGEGPWEVKHDRNDQPNIHSRNHWIALFPHQCLTSLEALANARAKFVVAAHTRMPKLLTQIHTMREVLASQAEMIESDVTAADQHGKGGQQAGVPRLVVTPPSVRDYLRRIARDLREALDTEEHPKTPKYWGEYFQEAVAALTAADTALDRITGWSGGSGHHSAQETHPRVQAALLLLRGKYGDDPRVDAFLAELNKVEP